MYKFLVFKRGRWRVAKIGIRHNDFRLAAFSTHFFRKETLFNLRQVAQAQKWANKRKYDYRYIQVIRHEWD